MKLLLTLTGSFAFILFACFNVSTSWAQRAMGGMAQPGMGNNMQGGMGMGGMQGGMGMGGMQGGMGMGGMGGMGMGGMGQGGMGAGMGGMQGGMGGMQGGMGQGGMGQGGMGQGGMGGMGQGGMGMGGMGGMQGGMGGMQGGMGMMGNQQLRQMQQMQMGLPAGAMGQNAFVGGDAATTQGFFQNLGIGQQQPMGNEFMIENLNERRADRGQQTGRTAEPPPVRVQIRPGFEPQEIGTGAVSNNIRARLQQRLSNTNAAGVQVRVEGRNATLVGSVATEHERALIDRIVRMEPGISQVENALIVDPQATSPAP